MPSWKQDFHKLQTPKIISYYELTDSHAVQELFRERKLTSAKIERTQKQMAEKTTSPSKKTTFILQILQTMARNHLTSTTRWIGIHSRGPRNLVTKDSIWQRSSSLPELCNN
jgi:hypothetical protein